MNQLQALAILKTGVNVFLTGEPGAGKTHTINEYVSYLHDHGIDPAITASTGIAATHIGGMTIHSWSGIGIKAKLDGRDLRAIASSQYLERRIKPAKILIIDEVSMLTPETLVMVDTVCRHIKQISDPFGGMQVVFVGDFFQLPPVVKTDWQQDEQMTFMDASMARFSYNSPSWIAADPTVCYLTEQYRQDDSEFLDVLSAIRHNTFRSEHLQHIQKRKITSDAVPKSAPKLFSHNADVDRVNDEILATISGEPRIFTMVDTGLAPLIASIKRGCLSPELLVLKVGAAVMFTKNNPWEGFVNGTLGVVESFDQASGYPVVLTRQGSRITVDPMDWSIDENDQVLAQISQLPLRLAWAITVHKSQGMSLDEAVMDLSHVFEFGQGYVALSRVRRLSGLFILGWNEQAFQVHPEILEKDEEFQRLSRTTEISFSKISMDQLQKKHNDFIILSGGKRQSTDYKKSFRYAQKDVKQTTYHETFVLWNEGKTIAQIAKARGVKESTIYSHIEKLVTDGKIPRTDLSRLLNPDLQRVLPVIHGAFAELSSDKLSPIFQKFDGKYSYDLLRIARMLL